MCQIKQLVLIPPYPFGEVVAVCRPRFANQLFELVLINLPDVKAHIKASLNLKTTLVVACLVRTLHGFGHNPVFLGGEYLKIRFVDGSGIVFSIVMGGSCTCGMYNGCYYFWVLSFHSHSFQAPCVAGDVFLC